MISLISICVGWPAHNIPANLFYSKTVISNNKKMVADSENIAPGSLATDYIQASDT